MRDKKFLKKLVLASFTDNSLNQENVEKITSYLTRKELKSYIRSLKQRVQQLSVHITVPVHLNRKDEEQLESIFPTKKITVSTDPNLILGILIQDNDTIYDMSLKNTLLSAQSYIFENYDK